jgi:TRAP-type transport system small permease protein
MTFSIRYIGAALRLLLARAVAALMIVIVLLVAAQVVARYVFLVPTFGLSEVTRLLFVWLTFVGSSLLISNRQMIAVDLLHDKLVEHWARRVQICNDLLTGAMLLVFAVYGKELLDIIGPKIAPATGMSYFWFYSSLPFFCTISFFFVLERLLTGATDI